MPLATVGGYPLDGSQRAEICLELGKPIRTIELTEEQAPPYLFSVHPERAVQRYAPESLSRATELFHCSASQVASYLAAPAPKPRDPWRAGVVRMVHNEPCRILQVWVPRSWKTRMAAAARSGRAGNVSAWIRQLVAAELESTGF